MDDEGDQHDAMSELPSEEQMLALLDFMEQYPFLVSMRGAKFATLWIQIARQLNAMENGVQLTHLQWRQFWLDKKLDFKLGLVGDGSDEIRTEDEIKKEIDFTEFERRMVALGVLEDDDEEDDGDSSNAENEFAQLFEDDEDEEEEEDESLPAMPEGSSELVWESSSDVLRKRAARARRAAFASRRHACAPCALSFKTENALAVHSLQLHCEGPDAVACDICGCRAPDAALAAEHRATHCVLRCRRCRFDTRSLYKMRRHILSHDNQQGPFTCDICARQFAGSQHYLAHRKTHTSIVTYECEHCGSEYRTRHQIYRHLRRHRMCYLCEICGKMCSNLSSLKFHSLAHSEPSARPFECTLCGKRYTTKFKLDVHKMCHTGERPYRCELCPDRCFREKAQLALHNRKMHSGGVVHKKRPVARTKSNYVNKRFVEPKVIVEGTDEQPLGPGTETDEGNPKRVRTKRKGRPRKEKVDLICPDCGKDFKDKWRLKFHLGVHSDDRPYKCDMCELTFKYQSGLWTHKLIHKGVKPHECNICGSRFTEKGNLTAHLKIHTDEKPFACNVCSNRFRVRRNLKNHMKIHYKTEKVTVVETSYDM